MTQLELLGMNDDNTSILLMDEDENTYALAITAELTALFNESAEPDASATQNATHTTNHDTENTPKSLSPREIQALLRAGQTLEDLSTVVSLPTNQLERLAHPIFTERAYLAEQARSYRLGKDCGDFTLNELVISRLIEQNVNASDIKWDAIRNVDEPWILIAEYELSGQIQQAKWKVNTKAHSLMALNEPAVELTETQIPAPSDPWKTLRTQNLASLQDYKQENSNTLKSEKKTIPLVEDTHSDLEVDEVLTSLEKQRGKNRPLPEVDEFAEFYEEETIPLFPAKNNDAQPTEKKAKIYALPSDNELPIAYPITETETVTTPEPLETTTEPIKPVIEKIEEKVAKAEKTAKKNRKNRPAMPSWEEIVFGYAKDDDK